MDFPGYRIEREIGKGGMATVYLAIQESLHRLVALKVMEPRLAANENFAERFLKEGRIIACLDHSQIVTVYDFGAYKENYYLSMEYFPGGTLEQKIRSGLSLEEVISIIKIISKALGYAHSQGVLHRDIKPQNILFRKDGSPVLTDFGIARFVDDTMQLTAPGFTVGSPLYMSPERIMGKKIDARSDLYSLGVLFYQMLTAQLPYQADNSIGVALKQCSAPVPVLPRELAKFQTILEQLLAKNPEDRFPTAETFVEALNSVEVTHLPSFWRSLAKLPATLKGSFSKKSRLSYKRWALAGIVAATLTAGIYFAVDFAYETPDASLASYLEALPAANNQRSSIAARYEALAIDHFNERNIDQSLNIIAIGLNAAPEDERLLALRERVQNFRQAENFLQQAEQEKQAGDLRNSLLLIQKGLGLVATHPDLLALREDIKPIVQRQQQDVREYLQQAQDYERDDQLPKALAALEKGLRLVPDHESLLALRQELKAKQQQTLSRILRQVGEYRRSGALKESLTVLQTGLELAPNHPVLRKLEAQVTTQIEEQEKATAFLAKAQKSYENKAYEDSLEIIQQGLQLVPGHPGLRDLQNKAANALEQQREIAQLLGQCTDHFRANRLTSGRQGNAVTCYRSVLQRDPANTKAMAGLEQVANRYIIWATAALQRGNLNVVKSYVTRLEQVDPNHPKLATLQAALEKPSVRAATEGVARAQFTTGIEAREPINRMASVIPVRENALPLYYFTEIRNMSGETITHLWKYNGNIVSKKSFAIGGSRWRVFSRKDLAPEMTGRWQVIVVDSSGQTIDSSSFVYDSHSLKSAEQNKF
jgi:serine/threonine-protein kinase PpkA